MPNPRFRLMVSLDQALALALQQAARQDCRTPEQQIVWLLRREFAQADQGIQPNSVETLPHAPQGQSKEEE